MFNHPFLRSLSILGLCIGSLSAQTSVQVGFANTVQTYTGQNLLPTVVTVPDGIQTQLSLTPRVSETVYKTIPQTLDLSYEGLALNGTNVRALGDSINLGGTNRILESVDVVLVSHTQASSYATLPGHNPAGYRHPVTAIVYNRDGNSLTVLAQRTEEILIPWRPATLSDGSAYPYSGFAFKARINFPPVLNAPLSGTIGVLIAYNTQSSGFNPIGVAGPYNGLNIALTPVVPTIGTDFNSGRILWNTNGLSEPNGYGPKAPLLEVRSFPANPPSGTPVNAGDYYVTATVVQSGYQGSGTTNFTILPVTNQISLTNLKQLVDGSPKPATVTTNPAGLSYSIVCAGSETAPSAPGTYPVVARITAANRTGTATGTLTLGKTLSSWIQPWITNGSVPAGKSGALDDPDGDGFSNLMEYATGSNPGTADILSQLILKDNGATWSLKYRKQVLPFDLTYKVQSSTTLNDAGAWSDLPGTPTLLTTVDGIQTMELIHPKAANTEKRFYRLLVTQSGSF